uniref:Uncharacterized protein n=1 Tax=Amphimedon queenslandica TaxID=400682 RepID=A0A1X7SJY9_AMPQE
MENSLLAIFDAKDPVHVAFSYFQNMYMYLQKF